MSQTRVTDSPRPSQVRAPFGRRSVAVTGRECHGAYVVLRCADPEGPRPQAGQFYMLSAATRWGGGDAERPFLPRAFSVLRAGHDDAGGLELQFLIEDVGPGSKRLCELAPGDGLALVGPLGVGFAHPREGRPPLLVGGGVGIAPLAIWQDQLREAPAVAGYGDDSHAADTPALLGFRDASHAPGAGLLRGATVATDDGTVGHHGLVTELLSERLDHSRWIEVYACGPPAMLEAVREMCARRQVPAQLALESGMACGFGACFGCVVPTREGLVRLCLEGPVIDAALLDNTVVPGAGH